MKTDGIVPIKGPTYGIIFETPMITLITRAYGILKTNAPIKHITPNAMASRSLPSTKFWISHLHAAYYV